MRIRVVAASAICLLTPICAALADPIGINQLVVFGDSLSDNGNAAAALASVGQTLGNYASNALTDGPNTTPATAGPYGLWIDQFASKFGLPDPTPFVVNTLPNTPGGNPGLTVNPKGTNFAVASALAGSNPSFNPSNFLNPTNPQAPGTTDQVGLYSSLTGGKASASTLYVLWAGANNIFNALSNPSGFLTLNSTAKTAADDIASNISTLAGEGGKNFLWFNLPPLGEIPYIQDNSNPIIKSLGATAGNAAAAAFNSEMSTDAASLEKTLGVNIVQVDINSLFGQLASDPGKYGFVDVKDAGWCGTDGVSTCASNNPNGFLFWDELHPTTAADALIADAVENEVSGIFTPAGSSPSSVPEPAPFALVAMGAAGIFWLIQKKRSSR